MDSRSDLTLRKKTAARGSDSILIGTTLAIYKFMIKYDKPISAREIQRQLNLKSPSTAQFHLDKLARNEFITRSDLNDGKYVVDKLFLNHYMKFKRFVFPRYLMYAILSASFLTGWIGSLFLGVSRISPQEFFSLFYGMTTTIILCGIFWYETLRSAKHDRI